ncbi:MAG: hypothetical protein KDK99_16770 [Verrucomicrobiales bacterium]|nr:hypothetical protein [Verrucomicrobiales bacterium]
MKTSSLLQLKSLIQEKFPTAMSSHEPSATPDTDDLVPGRLLEIASPLSAGAGLLMQHFIASAPGPCALVDAGDGFDPEGLPARLLAKLLWVRCLQLETAIKAADLLLRDGNLTTLIVDLRLQTARDLLRQPSSVWHRLRLLAEKSRVATGIFTPARVVSCAARRWHLEPRLTLPQLEESRDLLQQRLRQGLLHHVHPALPLAS